MPIRLRKTNIESPALVAMTFRSFSSNFSKRGKVINLCLWKTTGSNFTTRERRARPTAPATPSSLILQKLGLVATGLRLRKCIHAHVFYGQLPRLSISFPFPSLLCPSLALLPPFSSFLRANSPILPPTRYRASIGSVSEHRVRDIFAG